MPDLLGDHATERSPFWTQRWQMETSSAEILGVVTVVVSVRSHLIAA